MSYFSENKTPALNNFLHSLSSKYLAKEISIIISTLEMGKLERSQQYQKSADQQKSGKGTQISHIQCRALILDLTFGTIQNRSKTNF